MIPGMSSCVELLIAEHRDTERLLTTIESNLLRLGEAQTGSSALWEAVSADYQTLADDLYRHFMLEERALFSLLSQYRSMMLMEVEHDDLLNLQQAFETSLKASVISTVPEPKLLPAFEAFKIRLQGHMLEEERGIFPLAEMWLEPEERLRALRVYQELRASFEGQPVSLRRGIPGFQIRETNLYQPAEKLLSYETLYEREHASVRHIRIKAGARQALHWAGQHQCMILVSGSVELETETGTTSIHEGQSITIDSRLYFALKANTDAHVLVFAVWPHPHYTKTPERGSESP